MNRPDFSNQHFYHTLRNLRAILNSGYIWAATGLGFGLISLFIPNAWLTITLFVVFGLGTGLVIERSTRIATQDPLTGLYNRRYLLDSLLEHIEMTNRYSEPFCLIMFDLDSFKKVNDQYGHLVGDKTLKAVAKVLMKECRTMDISARYGGEEFMIICPHTDQNMGYQLAERMRKIIAEIPSNALGYPGPQTISVGIVAVQQDQNLSVDELIRLVDEALYKAKKQGKNQVIPASHL